MANRRFEQFQLGLEKAVVNLWGSVAIGATGAPTLSASKSKGIQSIVRNSAGNYTIQLQDKYNYLIFMDSCINLNSGAPSTGTNLNCVVRADNSASTTPTVQVEFLSSAGAAVDLANGCTFMFNMQLKNSTV